MTRITPLLIFNFYLWFFVQTEHKGLVSKYEQHKVATIALKRKHEDDSKDLQQSTPVTVSSDIFAATSKRAKVQSALHASSVTITQAQVDKLIVNYIIQGMRPLSTVEEKSFVDMIVGLQPTKTVMTRKTLSVRLDVAYQTMVEQMTASLAAVEYVCTTADIWSCCNKSYFGVTVHWISSDFQRCSRVLACRRF